MFRHENKNGMNRNTTKSCAEKKLNQLGEFMKASSNTFFACVFACLITANTVYLILFERSSVM